MMLEMGASSFAAAFLGRRISPRAAWGFAWLVAGAGIAACASFSGTDPPTPDDAGAESGPMIDAAADDADGGPTTIVAFAMGNAHACVVRSSGVVRCWGRTLCGALGPRGTPEVSCNNATCRVEPVTVPLPGNAVEVALGLQFGCARLDSGEVWCWGSNFAGQLGSAGGDEGACLLGNPYVSDPTPRKVPIPKATAIRASLTAVCATTDAGLQCWGSNRLGLMGRGTATMPTSSADWAPSAPGLVTLTGPVQDVVMNEDYAACAIVGAEKALHCWGSRRGPTLGSEPSDGTDAGCGASCAPLPAPIRWPDGGVVTDVASAALVQHGGCLALAKARHPHCWGSNETGLLGKEDASASQPFPEIVTLPFDSTPLLAGKRDFMCARPGTFGVACWGNDRLGTLGRGGVDGGSCGDACSATPVAVQGLPSAGGLAVGDRAALALVNGELYGWGHNLYGQLGVAPGTGGGDAPCAESAGQWCMYSAQKLKNAP